MSKSEAKQRGSSVRKGRTGGAILAAVSALTASGVAKADITNGFAGFAPVNFVGQTGGSVGYTNNAGTFVVTDNRGGEAVSGFATSQQNIASFDATYIYQETGTGPADGLTFTIQNNSSGTAAVGASGGGLGYSGITSSAALEFNIYNGYTIGSGFNTNGVVSNAYTGTGNVSLTSGHPIQVTLEYFNNTLTENLVDLTSNASYGRIFTNINIPAALGGSTTGFVGFTGGTGGNTATQQLSGFTFVSGTGPTGTRQYAPIAIGGFNQQGVITVASGASTVTATMDGGTAKNGDTWYEKGWNTFNTSTGIPTSGSTFISQYDSAHVFTMANYSSNDVVLLSTASKTATISFNTPSAYSAVSFLESCGSGPSSFKVTVNYADGAASTTGLSVITPDWFNGGPSAWFAHGRDTITSNASSSPDSYAQGTGAGTGPNLYEEDLILPNSTDPISSLSLTFSGTNASTNMMIFAVSGVVANNAPILLYTGAAVPGKFDSSTINFSQTSSGSTTPVAFSNGSIVQFDDTASDTTHAITVATVSGGIKVGGLIFNNTTATAPYVFGGAGIGGPGGLSVNGGGTVVLNNPNTFSGDTQVNSGTLVVGSTGTLASTNISVGSTGTFNVMSGGVLSVGPAVNLSDYGTVNFFNPARTLAGLSGSGVVNLNGTALTIGTTSFTGTIGGTAGSVTFTAGGTFGGTINDGTSSPISVTINNSTGSILTLGNPNTYSGGTTLVAGLTRIGSNTALGTNNVVLAGGQLAASAPLVILTNTLTGGALVVGNASNAGQLNVLELNGTNTFTGPIVVDGSSGTAGGYGETLQVDSAAALGHLNTASGAVAIIVGSGGALQIGDNDPNIGLVNGQPVTAQISGVGSTAQNTSAGSQVGALVGIAGASNAVFAGNVVTAGATTIAAGNGGSFTLTGAITGTGPVSFTGNTNSTLFLNGSGSSYAGESVVNGDPSTFAQTTVKLGVDNGFSPAAGFNVLTTNPGPLVVDLNGHNQSVTYLTGSAKSGYSITNGGGSPSTLTISNGNTATGVATFATAITDGNSPLAIAKTGTGNQILTGANTYSGGTNVAGGTLTVAAPGAIGSGVVTLSGGTIAFGGGSPIAAPVVTGFTTFAAGNGVLLNTGVANPATVNGSTLVLTNNTPHANASIFTANKVGLNLTTGFTVSYLYTPNDPANNSAYTADGLAFVLQNDPRGTTALGDGGGAKGYAGNNSNYPSISTSFAAALDIYAFDNGNDVGFGTNGTLGANANTFSIRSQPDQVTLSYNGSTHQISETVTNAGNTAQTYTGTYNVDLGAVLGSSSAYVGFTGGEGDGSAQQLVQNFVLSNYVNGPIGVTNSIVAQANTSSTISAAVASGYTAQAVGAITINPGATITLAATGNVSSPRMVLTTPSVAFNAGAGTTYTGKLDIAGNDLDITTSDIVTVTGLVRTGFAGNWTGPGITSSLAAADSRHITAVGVILNNVNGTQLYGSGTTLGLFDGANPGSSDVLVKYTYFGDANLDGKVDGSDYTLIDNGYLTAGSTGWYNGDFNYDGKVDASDYTLIDNGYNRQGVTLVSSALVASPTALIASAPTSAVPEPTTVGMIAVAAGMLGRRRPRLLTRGR